MLALSRAPWALPGSWQAIDLTALVARVADLERRLKVADDKIEACEGRTDDGKTAQQAADALALQTQQEVKDVESDLSVLEGSVILVTKIVSAMSECDKQGLHHGWLVAGCAPPPHTHTPPPPPTHPSTHLSPGLCYCFNSH